MCNGRRLDSLLSGGQTPGAGRSFMWLYPIPTAPLRLITAQMHLRLSKIRYYYQAMLQTQTQLLHEAMNINLLLNSHFKNIWQNSLIRFRQFNKQWGFRSRCWAGVSERQTDRETEGGRKRRGVVRGRRRGMHTFSMSLCLSLLLSHTYMHKHLGRRLSVS